jgi:alkylation response protein AidB-like acyl-CoA dehydrogenase
MPFRAPVAEYRFILDQVVPLAQVAATARFGAAQPDLAEAVLTEAARVADAVIAPLNRAGDKTPARLENGVVRTSPGFAAGYRALAEGGWIATAAPVEYGGMGLPQALNACVNDMMSGACMALQLNPVLAQGQIEALEHHASDEIKALYLPRLISGEWTGTMNLTEPQAGTDVGALRTRAEPAGDGTYKITGQKIFITWGDHDFGGNVCHLVLARLPDAVPGVKGISLFMVPKFIPGRDGSLGRRNALQVVSLEHKMGIHGSPTCVMAYEGATGWLVGAPHQGMAAMFTMMNNARLAVGMQGIGVAEAAWQQALDYARERRQMGRIADHPDVRRMLWSARADIFAARAIGLACAAATDMAVATGDAAWKARAALLTPVAKSFGSEVGSEVSDMAVQVHGGMGFIEETGVAQFYRDVRIASIYEGTNGIQAIDLVGRKLADGGEALFRLLDEVEAGAEVARAALPALAGAVWSAAESLREATEAMVATDAGRRQAGALPFLRALARVLGAHFHLRAALADPARLPLAEVYVGRLLPRFAAHLAEVRAGGEALMAIDPDDMAA